MRVLTVDDEHALQHFAREHGRYWKQTLRDEWMRACSRIPENSFDLRREIIVEYRSVLQRLRNDPDFSTRGLEKYRLPVGLR